MGLTNRLETSLCVSVSVSELLATASQRHVVPLQGRPYEEDQVTGLLTVEFLFTSAQAEVSGASHSEARTVVNRPVGSIMKQNSAFTEEAPNDNLFKSDNNKKGFSPYFDYNSPGYSQSDLKPSVSRSSSKNRKTMFAEPLETPCDPVPNALMEISNCQNPVTSSSQNNVNGEMRRRDLIKYMYQVFVLIQM